MYEENLSAAFTAEVYKAASLQLMKQYAGDKMRRPPRAAIGRKLRRLVRYYFAASSGKLRRKN